MTRRRGHVACDGRAVGVESSDRLSRLSFKNRFESFQITCKTRGCRGRGTCGGFRGLAEASCHRTPACRTSHACKNICCSCSPEAHPSDEQQFSVRFLHATYWISKRSWARGRPASRSGLAGIGRCRCAVRSKRSARKRRRGSSFFDHSRDFRGILGILGDKGSHGDATEARSRDAFFPFDGRRSWWKEGTYTRRNHRQGEDGTTGDARKFSA